MGEEYGRDDDVDLSSSVMLWPLEDELRAAEREDEPWDLRVVSCTTSPAESKSPCTSSQLLRLSTGLPLIWEGKGRAW